MATSCSCLPHFLEDLPSYDLQDESAFMLCSCTYDADPRLTDHNETEPTTTSLKTVSDVSLQPTPKPYRWKELSVGGLGSGSSNDHLRHNPSLRDSGTAILDLAGQAVTPPCTLAHKFNDFRGSAKPSLLLPSTLNAGQLGFRRPLTVSGNVGDADGA